MRKFYFFLCILAIFSFYVPSYSQGVNRLWGLTSAGGEANIGALFSMPGNGTNVYLEHGFPFINKGTNPQHTDLSYFNGKFYGLTSSGGSGGNGVIFEWDPANNVYINKIDFADERNPFGSLTLFNNKFYGMTNAGGAYDRGVIFEWDPSDNSYTKKIDFDQNNGAYPLGNSLTAYNNKLYGMTTDGGQNGGTIFEWDPSSNIFTKKIDLTDGTNPKGSLTLSGGKFYGMTQLGGASNAGVIFEWDPSDNSYSKKIDFDQNNGAHPLGSLILHNSKFYSMTNGGGDYRAGVIFEWDPSNNSYTKKIDFDQSNGAEPSNSSLISYNGKFYGLTAGGGTDGYGVIFEWDPSNNMFTKKKDFNYADGAYPNGSLTYIGGKFYGLTNTGGSTYAGVIFEFDPSNDSYTKKLEFFTSDGANPFGYLTRNGRKFYGMTNIGGTDNAGVIFEFDPSNRMYTKKIDFKSIDGANPTSSLTLNGSKFYGMTRFGGAYNAGVIFEFDPLSNAYMKKIEFDNNNGANPYGNLTLYNGKFYGLTARGGVNGYGVIFEWDPSNNLYTSHKEFNLTDGAYPQGDLTLNNGMFYGMTLEGGRNGAGVIFEWDPSTNIYDVETNFNADPMGANPNGSLTLLEDKLYGMTKQGGAGRSGVIFEWNPTTNVFTKMIDFNGTNGASPYGNLTLNNNKFYGSTSLGGAFNNGILFEWDPATNIYEIKYEFTGGYGANPFSGLIAVPAPVSAGQAGSCEAYSSVTIDNNNNNIWMPFIDSRGDVVAEIKANGNNLGIVTAQMFINNGSVREDGARQLYLDRSVTLTPQTQPSSAVDIRLYIKDAEFTALKNAVNSSGQPSGVITINDLAIYKSNENCFASATLIANPISTVPAAYETEYVLSASITSFSSFYFANASLGLLPQTLLEFKGHLEKNDGILAWKTANEVNTFNFVIERSVDRRNYHEVGMVAATGRSESVNFYKFTDPAIISLGVPTVYYRLQLKESGGRFTYSKIIALPVHSESATVTLYPNPIINESSLMITLKESENLQWQIIDNMGKIVQQHNRVLPKGSTNMMIHVKGLRSGVYYLRIRSSSFQQQIKFLKY